MPRSTGALLWAVLLVAGISSTCGDGSNSSPASPNPLAPCTTGEIRSTVWSATSGGGAQPVGVSGGSFSARVTVIGHCQWTVISGATWVTPDAGALGGPGSVSINTAAGCSWWIEAEQGSVAWIMINLGQRGAGPATIPYTIQPNQSLSSRTASIVVRGDSGNARLVQTVTQAGASG